MTAMTCKIKNFLALVVSVSLTSLIFVCFFGRDRPVDLQNFVTQTHRQLESLKENFQTGSGERKLDLVEDKYLKLLGFNKDSQETTIAHRPTFDTTEFSLKNGSLPVVVVSAITRSLRYEEEDFLKSVESALPSNPIVIWNLDPTGVSSDTDETEFSVELKQTCNSSKCWVERFKYEDYPDHVRDLSLRAYRPLIIQTMLDRGGCILWLDIDRRLLPFEKETLGEFLTLAMQGGSEGIIGWSTAHPTSTLTHPKMFSFFETEAENFYFHRMIDPAQLLVCNTNTVHSKVMLPWVKCSLTKDCISPFGSQSGGCRFDKKPLYRYSGCHAYDSSALNVALGLAFPLHQPYISRAPITRPVEVTRSNQNQSTTSS